MSDKFRIFVATSPFGKTGKKPLELLEETGWEIIHNPFNRRLKGNEVKNFVHEFDAIIAGTELYPAEYLNNGRLKVISRVGIGLDNVPLQHCKDKGITVTYTPDAPSQGVAELTVGNIINLCRYTLPSDHSVREKAWNRFLGFLIQDITIGILGVGRIGKKVIKLLQPFGPNIFACDTCPDEKFGQEYNLKWVNKEELFSRTDMISIHIPNNKKNYHFVDRKTIALMKTGSFLINTSRGPVIDENALCDALSQKHLYGASLDVFEKEPYEGPLTQFDNVVLTAHMGASARTSRFLMELEATEDCIRVLKGEKPFHDAYEENKNDL
jgi:D-3-phosphoglycerate dehydrogenase